jgi:dTDP-4-amino-4,6-dideoxygalactose transaminase
VAVDYAGHPADLDELRAIADRHGLYLIEDAAHSIGSIYKGRPVGSIADITTFSFFPTKNLTTGEGGAVASIHPELLEKAKRFSRQGLVRNPIEFKINDQGPWHQEVHEFGLNYRLPDILCALGLSQLKRLGEFKDKKRAIFELYRNELQRNPDITLPIEKPYVNTNWHLVPVRVPESQRFSIYQKLRSEGIGVQVNYLPAHLHPVFHETEAQYGKFPISEQFYRQEISLPMHTSLEQTQIQRVINAVLKSVS